MEVKLSFGSKKYLNVNCFVDHPSYNKTTTEYFLTNRSVHNTLNIIKLQKYFYTVKDIAHFKISRRQDNINDTYGFHPGIRARRQFWLRIEGLRSPLVHALGGNGARGGCSEGSHIVAGASKVCPVQSGFRPALWTYRRSMTSRRTRYDSRSVRPTSALLELHPSNRLAVGSSTTEP